MSGELTARLARKPAGMIRSEAAAICEDWANVMLLTGNPEAYDVLQDAANEIRSIALTKSSKTSGSVE